MFIHTNMFVAIVDITLKKEKISEFKNWFSQSNKIVEKFEGYISRKLLESSDGSHRIIVEFTNKDLFVSMHQSADHAKLHEQIDKFMERPPIRKMYDVVAS